MHPVVAARALEAGSRVQPIAVEFAHPVIVGKRALPAFALTNDVATLTELAGAHGWGNAFARRLRCLALPADSASSICMLASSRR